MHTAATRRLQDALRTYAGVTGEPTFAEYLGYAAVDGLVTGLKAAGPQPTQASFIQAMLGITSYDAAGLYGTHSIGFSMAQRGRAAGADNCFWVTRFSGSSFHLVGAPTPSAAPSFPASRTPRPPDPHGRPRGEVSVAHARLGPPSRERPLSRRLTSSKRGMSNPK
jgi:hypothetical protein